MSWSIQFIGKPEKVVEALQKQSETMNGDSKVEYDAALPHLVGIVKENFGFDTLLKIVASGHGYSTGDKPNRTLTVNIESIYGVIV
jgi:hypothetical protein